MDGHKVVVKIDNADIVTFVLSHYTRFPRSYGYVSWSIFVLVRNCCLFDINTIASDITDSTLHGLRFSYVSNGYDVTSSFFHLSKIGWYNVCSKNYLIIGIFPSQIGLLTLLKKSMSSTEKSSSSLIAFLKGSLFCMMQGSWT